MVEIIKGEYNYIAHKVEESCLVCSTHMQVMFGYMVEPSLFKRML